ncbi:MAG: hypothetical protein JEY94_05590 [Melioribacteraceae bacterium]|nr:hypothetical protein [Melioribacteraceae bacterium]
MFSERTTQIERSKFYNNLIENTIENALTLEFDSLSEAKWGGAFWAMELSGYKSERTFNSIKKAFAVIDKTSDSFKRGILELIYTIYPNEFLVEAETLYRKTANHKVFAMAANYLLKSNQIELNEFNALLKNKFIDWEKSPVLSALYKHINLSRPANINLNEFFLTGLNGSPTIIYCLQRKNRDYEGLIIIRKSDRMFLRDKSGRIFSVPALARSVTNLPYYLTNGNTPQGIFSVLGLGNSSNVFIGPTSTIELGMPFEISPEDFFHSNSVKTKWDEVLYNNIIPVNLRKYSSLYESYFAGMAGRSEIIAHGSTINPEFYKTEIYYPNTPSLGCITLSELWDLKTGAREISNQNKLVNVLKELNLSDAFLILIEIDNKNAPIHLDEIEWPKENNLVK